jgi:hypothetical protein
MYWRAHKMSEENSGPKPSLVYGERVHSSVHQFALLACALFCTKGLFSARDACFRFHLNFRIWLATPRKA